MYPHHRFKTWQFSVSPLLRRQKSWVMSLVPVQRIKHEKKRQTDEQLGFISTHSLWNSDVVSFSRWHVYHLRYNPNPPYFLEVFFFSATRETVLVFFHTHWALLHFAPNDASVINIWKNPPKISSSFSVFSLRSVSVQLYLVHTCHYWQF